MWTAPAKPLLLINKVSDAAVRTLFLHYGVWLVSQSSTSFLSSFLSPPKPPRTQLPMFLIGKSCMTHLNVQVFENPSSRMWNPTVEKMDLARLGCVVFTAWASFSHFAISLLSGLGYSLLTLALSWVSPVWKHMERQCPTTSQGCHEGFPNQCLTPRGLREAGCALYHQHHNHVWWAMDEPTFLPPLKRKLRVNFVLACEEFHKSIFKN